MHILTKKPRCGSHILLATASQLKRRIPHCCCSPPIVLGWKPYSARPLHTSQAPESLHFNTRLAGPVMRLEPCMRVSVCMRVADSITTRAASFPFGGSLCVMLCKICLVADRRGHTRTPVHDSSRDLHPHDGDSHYVTRSSLSGPPIAHLGRQTSEPQEQQPTEKKRGKDISSKTAAASTSTLTGRGSNSLCCFTGLAG